MAFAVVGKLTGLKDVLRRLATLQSQTTRSKILRQALMTATKPMLDTARSLAPVEDGYLKKSLGRRAKTYRSSGIVVVMIGPRSGFTKGAKGGRPRLTAYGKGLRAKTWKRPTYYAHLVEFGTRPHAIAKGDSLRKKVQTGGMNPGARPRPFLQPAFERCKAGALATMKREIAAGIEKAAK